MKRVFSLLMIIAILLPVSNEIGVFVDFKINQNFIAKVLCINRDNPKLMCNGKCFLAAKLKKIEEQEKKQTPITKKEIQERTLYCSAIPIYILRLSEVYLHKQKVTYRDEFYFSSFLSDIYRPPKFNLI